MAIYLDNAATSSPKPDCVIRAVARALTEGNANPGRSGHARSLQAGRETLMCRETIANLLGAEDALCVIFAFNCTDALNLAIKGSLRRGDHVISSMIEHNSVLRVLKGLERGGQIELTLV
ncbi:MAG: aminotransferase class V-fold PLP-dependent enzyme, partial [Christensenellales bacterium]